METTLNQIAKLRRELDAKIVIQEEEGEFVDVEIENDWPWPSVSNAQYGPPSTHTRKIWVIQPMVTKPDVEKIESAKQQLQEMYTSSEWYFARYKAGMILGVKEINKELDGWLDVLEHNIFNYGNWTLNTPPKMRTESGEDIYIIHAPLGAAEKTEVVYERFKKSHADLSKLYEIATTRELRFKISRILNISVPAFLENELINSRYLTYKEIKVLFNNPDVSRETKRIAAEWMGYTPFSVYLQNALLILLIIIVPIILWITAWALWN